MKILFLYPNKVMVTRTPLGIGYLSSYMKRDGHEVRLFDTTFIKCGDTIGDEDLRASSLQVRNPDLKRHGIVEREGDVFTEFEKEVESFKPDMIATSVVDPNYKLGLELLRRIKKNHKNIISVIGGSTATFAPDEVIAEDCIDMLCIGEGEEAMSELCMKLQQGKDVTDVANFWVKTKDKIHKNDVRPLADINELLLPDWEIFDERHLLKPMAGKVYRLGIFAMTRGCLFRCKYCANLSLANIYKHKGQYYRVKKVDLMVKEMAHFKEKYNLNFAMFLDDLFPIHIPEVVEDFCSMYKSRVGLPFTINLHPTLVKEELFAKIVDSGCRNICVGLESGSPRIRENVLGRNYTNDQVVNVFNLAHKYGVRCSSFDMIGLPYEEREDIFDTIELNRKAKPTTTTLTFFHPYRGTELRRVCITEKLFDPDNEEKYEGVYRAESCLSLPQISKETLRGIFKTFQLYFKLPKIFYGLIRIAEKDSFLSKIVFSILKQVFYCVTRSEAKWDFKKVTDHPST